MRKRDFAIIFISAFAVFISLQHEGRFSFRDAWYHHLDDADLPTAHELEHLPPPVVVDLNGDGRSEVLFATHDARLQVLEPQLPLAGETFRESRVLAEVSLLSQKVRVVTGRQPVALAAGYLDPPPGSAPGGKKYRKAVIVVVTAGWTVLCYDHNLKLLWENNVQEDWPHGAHMKEVAILITNQTLKHEHRGMVVVGGSVEITPQLLDPLEEEEDLEHEEARHRRAADNKEALEDVSGDAAGLKDRHFSYYAFAGDTGHLWWKHESKDNHRDASLLIGQLLPQHNYKLDANSLNTRHFGEVECREYRESILGVVPHKWERRDDTFFQLAHFRKHRRRHHKKLPGPPGAARHPPAKQQAGRDAKNPVAHVVGKVVKMAASGKAKKAPPHQGQVNGTAHWWAPNAVVAHLKEGVEAIHLYSGRTICKLMLPAGGLHADINGDGVLDHVQASGAHGGERMVPVGLERPLEPCWAVATSGVPVKEQLFNGSICKPEAAHLFHPDFASRAFGRTDEEGTIPLEVATPVLLPRKDKHRHRRNSHGDVVFLNSRGEVSCYSTEGHHGKLRWQVASEAMWANPVAPAGLHFERVVPTLAALPLRAGGPAEVLLAVGESNAVVLSPHGVVEATFPVPLGPTAAAVIADFNNDRLNDLIIVTSMGIYGYVQVRQRGATLFSALLGCLIIGMGIVFVTQAVGTGKKPRKADRRSTD